MKRNHTVDMENYLGNLTLELDNNLGDSTLELGDNLGNSTLELAIPSPVPGNIMLLRQNKVFNNKKVLLEKFFAEPTGALSALGPKALPLDQALTVALTSFLKSPGAVSYPKTGMDIVSRFDPSSVLKNEEMAKLFGKPFSALNKFVSSVHSNDICMELFDKQKYQILGGLFVITGVAMTQFELLKILTNNSLYAGCKDGHITILYPALCQVLGEVCISIDGGITKTFEEFSDITHNFLTDYSRCLNIILQDSYAKSVEINTDLVKNSEALVEALAKIKTDSEAAKDLARIKSLEEGVGDKFLDSSISLLGWFYNEVSTTKVGATVAFIGTAGTLWVLWRNGVEVTSVLKSLMPMAKSASSSLPLSPQPPSIVNVIFSTNDAAKMLSGGH